MGVDASGMRASEYLDRTGRSLAAALTGGFVAGLLVGGIASRLAMRVLFLTTGPAVRGLTSDDGFAIGRFDVGATAGLLAFGAVAGALGGGVYLLARRAFPADVRWRSLLFGSVCAVVVGSAIIHTDGVDFTVLHPRWLSIALFIAIPGLYGAGAAALIERLDRPDGWFKTARAPRAMSPLLLLLFPPLGIGIGVPVVVGAAAVLLAGRIGAVGRLLGGPWADWTVRAGLAALIGWRGVALYQDIATLI